MTSKKKYITIRRMKPEPLKNKINRCIELMAIIQEEVGEAQKELNNIWFTKPEGDWNKFKEEVKQIVSPLNELLELLGFKTEKQRVQGLLEEIEKERVGIYPEEEGYSVEYEADGEFVRFETVKEKIKKWFGDVNGMDNEKYR